MRDVELYRECAISVQWPKVISHLTKQTVEE